MTARCRSPAGAAPRCARSTYRRQEFRHIGDVADDVGDREAERRRADLAAEIAQCVAPKEARRRWRSDRRPPPRAPPRLSEAGSRRNVDMTAARRAGFEVDRQNVDARGAGYQGENELDRHAEFVQGAGSRGAGMLPETEAGGQRRIGRRLGCCRS